MQILHPPELDAPGPCTYLPERQKQFEFFFAAGLSEEDLSRVLSEGWRKFGLYFFRPRCSECRDCIPLRVPVVDFTPSRSQRRVLRRNEGLRTRFGPLNFTEDVFRLYRDHALARFGQQSSLDEFITGFYQPSAPAMQLDIFLDEVQIGAGFLDVGSDCLSSVYFCFDPAYEHLGLGTYSVLKEIERARQMGLAYYYLGYYVSDCPTMQYKDHFLPRQYFNWQTGLWRDV